ncbi:MAG: hypothetical protein JJT96_16035 [Opitutales bacterium]|nr:hypothetical protein [Opitutales bacterium]
MERVRLIVCLLAAFALCAVPLRADAETAIDPALAELLAGMRASERIEAAFAERRHHPLRRVPSRFAGVLRRDPALGISLAYTQPREQVVSVLPDGLWRTRPDDSPARLPASEEGDALRFALLALFTFDAEKWKESFDIEFSEATGEGTWRIDLYPLAGQPAGSLISALVLQGSEQVLERMEIRRPNRSRIEIFITEPRSPEAWPPDVRAVAFPVAPAEGDGESIPSTPHGH